MSWPYGYLHVIESFQIGGMIVRYWPNPTDYTPSCEWIVPNTLNLNA